jgi:hypothetical protein
LGNVVSAARNDVSYDDSLLTWNSCAINPAIGPASAADRQLTASVLGAGAERVDVDGPLPATIPDGPLYICELRVSPSAPLGAIPLGNTPAAFDQDGVAIPGATGTAGQVIVTTCNGDCDGNGAVTIGELTRCINAFLGQPLCNPTSPALSCPAADTDGSGGVSIGEVVNCVSRFLGGC